MFSSEAWRNEIINDGDVFKFYYIHYGLLKPKNWVLPDSERFQQLEDFEKVSYLVGNLSLILEKLGSACGKSLDGHERGLCFYYDDVAIY